MNALMTTDATADASWPAAIAADLPGMLLGRMLEQIDYGLLLIGAGGALRYANQLGLREVHAGGALRLAAGRLGTVAERDQAVLGNALADAWRGRRRLFVLGAHGALLTAAAVPVAGDDAERGGGLALLVLGRRQPTDSLTVDFYARSHALTGAELNVLKALCAGARPKEVARAHGVSITTVRTQIGSIRTKTHTASIRELVDRVAALPPISPVLKPMWPAAQGVMH